jgi:hypothetical protein
VQESLKLSRESNVPRVEKDCHERGTPSFSSIISFSWAKVVVGETHTWIDPKSLELTSNDRRAAGLVLISPKKREGFSQYRSHKSSRN